MEHGWMEHGWMEYGWMEYGGSGSRGGLNGGLNGHRNGCCYGVRPWWEAGDDGLSRTTLRHYPDNEIL